MSYNTRHLSTFNCGRWAHLDAHSHCFHHKHFLRLGRVGWNSVPVSWMCANDANILWLRLNNHSNCIPLPCHTYTKCLSLIWHTAGPTCPRHSNCPRISHQGVSKWGALIGRVHIIATELVRESALHCQIIQNMLPHDHLLHCSKAP